MSVGLLRQKILKRLTTSAIVVPLSKSKAVCSSQNHSSRQNLSWLDETMRVPITAAFDSWLMQQQPWYPYGSLQGTRQSIFCKWIMVRGRSVFHENFAVLANCFSNEVLLEMIRTKQAMPLPPLGLSQVMDGMLYWRNIDYDWHQFVVDRVFQFVHAGAEQETMDVVRILINMRIQVMIEEYFGHTLIYDIVYADWVQWFDGTYKRTDFHGHYSFIQSNCALLVPVCSRVHCRYEQQHLRGRS